MTEPRCPEHRRWQWRGILVDLNVDIAIATVTINIIVGGTTTTASMDYEVCLNP